MAALPPEPRAPRSSPTPAAPSSSGRRAARRPNHAGDPELDRLRGQHGLERGGQLVARPGPGHQRHPGVRLGLPGLTNFTSNNNLAAGFTVGQIIINDASATSNFSLLGNAINLGLGITHSSDATTSVGFTGITFNGPQNFVNNLGQLNVTSPLNLLTHSLTVSGAGNTTLSGSISGAAASSNLNKIGAGTLTLSANNTYNGSTSVGQGTVVAAAANALGSVNGSTSVASGATLTLPGGVALAAEQINIAGNGVGGVGALRSLAGNNSIAGAVRSAAQGTPGLQGLQNVAAIYSQGSWDVATVIDGNFKTTTAGPTTYPAINNTAVFETVSDLGWRRV